MNYIQIEFFIVVFGLILIFLELNKIWQFRTILIFILGFLFYNSCLVLDVWHVEFSSCDIWRSLILGLVFFSFLNILILIKDFRLEIIILNYIVFLGSLIVITSDNLVLIFLGLELQTFSLFVLISKNKNSIKGSEASLKYFILGALSSGFYLLGLSLILYLGLSVNIKDLYLILDFNIYLNKILIILIVLSLFFKLALFPLHFWIPDIYEGSSWEVLSLLSIIPKISVISVVIQLYNNMELFLFCSILSIIIGTFGAFNQVKLKRLLAYSGIAHIGFMMLGLSISSNQGYEITFIYLLIYIITLIGLFLLVKVTPFNKDYYLIDLGNIFTYNKLLGLTWIVFFLSIAGIPPLSGFISKWLILWTMISYNYVWVSIIGIIFSAIGAGYYLRVVKIVYFQNKSSYLLWNEALSLKKTDYFLESFIIGLNLYIVCFLILNPTPLIITLYSSFNYFF